MLANAYARHAGLPRLENPHGPRGDEMLYRFSQKNRPSVISMRKNARWFTVVRNPYVRVLSAYLDKIRRGRGERDFFCRVNGLKDGAEVDFETFVHGIASAKTEHQNQHWAPQVEICLPSLVRYDHVGTLEDFSATISWLRNQGRVSVSESDEFAPHRQFSAEKLNDFYTPELASVVRSVYQQDFDLLGYSIDLQNLAPLDSDAARTARLASIYDARLECLLDAHDLAAREKFSEAIKIARDWLSGPGASLADWADWQSLAAWSLAAGDRESARLSCERISRDSSNVGLLACAKIELLLFRNFGQARELAHRALELAPWSQDARGLLRNIESTFSPPTTHPSKSGGYLWRLVKKSSQSTA